VLGLPTLCHTKSGRFTHGLREGLALGDGRLLADGLPPVDAVTLAALCVSNVCVLPNNDQTPIPPRTMATITAAMRTTRRGLRNLLRFPVGVAWGLSPLGGARAGAGQRHVGYRKRRLCFRG
jgi:hypothetical protein